MRLSKSKVNSFMMCPRKFKYESIDEVPRPEPEEDSPLQVGLNVHSIFEKFTKEYTVEQIKEMSANQKYKILHTYDENNKYNNHILNFIDFITGVVNDDYEIYSVEQYIYNEKYDFSGILDLVLKKGDEIVIIDYKTGKPKSISQYHMELSYYIYLFESETGLKVTYAGIYFSKENKYRIAEAHVEESKGAVITDEDIEAGLEYLELIRLTVKSGNIQPKHQYLCKFCDYEERCNEEGGY